MGTLICNDVDSLVEHELEMVGKVGLRTLYVDPCPTSGDDEGRLLPVSGLLREAILAMVEQPVRKREPITNAASEASRPAFCLPD